MKTAIRFGVNATLFAFTYWVLSQRRRLAEVRRIANQSVLAQIARKDKDYNVRKEAVKTLVDQGSLVQLLKTEQDATIKEIIVGKITEPSALRAIVVSEADEWCRWLAVKNTTDIGLLFSIAANDGSVSVRLRAINTLRCLSASDQDAWYHLYSTTKEVDHRMRIVPMLSDLRILSTISQDEPQEQVRTFAIERGIAGVRSISTLDRLIAIATSEMPCEFREAAVKRLSKEDVLFRIAMSDESWEVRRAAVRNICDQNALTEIALSDTCWQSRVAAVERIESGDTLLQLVSDNVQRVEIRLSAITQLRDDNVASLECQQVLASIVNSETANAPLELRIEAVKKLADENTLCRIGMDKAEGKGIRVAAITHLKGEYEQVLFGIAKDEAEDERIRKAAIAGILNRGRLREAFELSLKAGYEDLTEDAAMRLSVEESTELYLLMFYERWPPRPVPLDDPMWFDPETGVARGPNYSDPHEMRYQFEGQYGWVFHKQGARWSEVGKLAFQMLLVERDDSWNADMFLTSGKYDSKQLVAAATIAKQVVSTKW